MLRNYLLTAYKVFMRRKLFTAINLACIVLTLVVLVMVAALLDTLFAPGGVEHRSDRFLQTVQVRMESRNGKDVSKSPLGFKLIDKYLKPMGGVERVAAVSMPLPATVYQGERASAFMLRRADADYWKIMDFRLLAGRLPDGADDAAGRAVAVLNRSTARKLFASESAEVSAAVGRPLDIGGQRFTVIGVVEDTMHFNSWSDIWTPIASTPTSDYRRDLTGPFTALILARDAADLPRVRADVERIARAVAADDPGAWKSVRFWADSKLDLVARMTVGSDDRADSGAGTLLAILVALMLLFMLLPALNLVNLNTGRILERHAEIGVRKAFGATSTQLALQFVVENILLSLVGGVAAFGIGAALLHWLATAGPVPLRVEMNLAVFAWGMLLSAVFGLVSGVLPAWKMARLDPVHALKGAI